MRGGRQGVELTPGLRFGRVGPNTALLESYLGPLPAKWRHRAIRSMLIGDWRDGNERVNSRSLIHASHLESVLARLPDREARVQVLRCLTDTDNLLRVHQGLLLTCLDALGYPVGLDAVSWWAAHRWAFVVEPDPERAARICQGWTDQARELLRARTSDLHEPAFSELALQIGACKDQEQGSWGGDAAFGAAFQRIRARLSQPDEPAPELGGSITWWP